MCWYFIKGFTYIFSQQLCEVGNICILYMRKVSTVWFTSVRAPWSGETRHDPVLAQDSNIRRPWTHSLHEYTKSIPIFRAVPSEEEPGTDWTASAQQMIKRPHKEYQKRQRHSNMGNPHIQHHCAEAQYWETERRFVCPGAQKKSPGLVGQLEYKGSRPRTLTSSRGVAGTVPGSEELANTTVPSFHLDRADGSRVWMP